MPKFLLAIDVGTGSARAAIFDAGGRVMSRKESPIALNTPEADHAEHDSEDIWAAVCTAVRSARADAAVPAEQIAGLSFDATCSLVVRDAQGMQLSCSHTGEPRWDTIVWLDHRALAEAEECTATRHPVLDYIGGVMSPEMQTPKLMWLKRHKPDTWHRAGYFFDLADFLLWRASGSTARSQCTLTCKWTYLAHEQQAWQESFFAAVGIPEILDRGALPSKASPIGMSVGPLTKAAAAELGLTVDCQVGVGLIDAHAGALGLLGALASDESAMESHLGVIAGTSTCVMALSPQPRPTPGVWGPYFGAVLPALWLNEGGQSATGALLDHIIANHAAGGEPSGDLHRRIMERIAALRAHEGPDFAGRLHVLPDFHGNRSPLADPHALGVISGLSLDRSFDSLCRLYWRTAVAIALGLRHIIEALNQQGFRIATLHVTGGHARSGLLLDLYADATGCTVVDYPQSDCVLLGTAMAAASACRLYPSLAVACRHMRQQGVERKPDRLAASRFDRDYRIFLEMHKHRRILEEWSQGDSVFNRT